MLNVRFEEHNLVKICTLDSCHVTTKCDFRYHIRCVSNKHYEKMRLVVMCMQELDAKFT